MGYTIRHDYKAVHHGGSRPASAIKHIVLHSIESTNATGAAEGAGSWFEQQASGGSTQYGVDDDSIQQYLSDLVMPWGAAGLNDSGVHIEQMGTASWSRATWMKHKGTLHRAAWLIARLSKRYDIPIRTLSDAELRADKPGVTTHAQSTRVFHVVGGHTDPGSGYPMDYVLRKAREFASGKIALTDQDISIPRQKKPHRAGWWNLGLVPYIEKLRAQGQGKRVKTGRDDVVIVPVPKTRPKWWRQMFAWKKSQR